MISLLWLLSLAVTAAEPAPSAFEFLDVETVDGRPLNKYRALELGERVVRPITWEVAPPGGVRHGLVPVGTTVETGVSVAWEPEGAVIWIDADGNRRFSRDERREVKPGAAVAIPVTIAGAGPAQRTILVRPGLLGGGPRYTVRGGMAGTVEMGGKRVRTLLIDGNADGCFNTAGSDRVWVDLDGDGRFDGVAEQFPLGSPITVGKTSYTVASDPWARRVSAHERDTRVGRLRLTLGGSGTPGKVVDVSANLVSKTGELVTVEALDVAAEAPVGRYRMVGLTLRLSDAEGRVWSYTFSGGREGTIDVAPGLESQAALFDGLALDVTLGLRESTRPGNEVDATPHLQLPSGLYLANCTTRLGETSREQERSASICLKAPGGATLDQAVSGFA